MRRGPPEKLLRARLPQAFCSVRSGRRPMERLDDNRPFGWFVGLAGQAALVRRWDRERARGGAERAPGSAFFTVFSTSFAN